MKHENERYLRAERVSQKECVSADCDAPTYYRLAAAGRQYRANHCGSSHWINDLPALGELPFEYIDQLSQLLRSHPSPDAEEQAKCCR